MSVKNSHINAAPKRVRAAGGALPAAGLRRGYLRRFWLPAVLLLALAAGGATYLALLWSGRHRLDLGVGLRLPRRRPGAEAAAR